jgi:arylsulfatase A-like enzyme
MAARRGFRIPPSRETRALRRRGELELAESIHDCGALKDGKMASSLCGICALAGLLGLVACGPSAPPNIVLVSLDTTRADHLGAYGYKGGTSPELDRFAERAVIYERAYATSSWTLPTHASMFTGLLPMQHGAQSVPEGPNRSLGYGVRPLAESFTTLAELLADAGYRTAAVVGGPALRSELGLAQGFEFYDDDLSGPGARFHGKRAEQVADAAIELVGRFGSEPWFLFVNFFDPHAPYNPPPPHDRGLQSADSITQLASLIESLETRAPPHTVDDYTEKQRQWIARMLAGYDAEIRYMDAHLGRLLAAITASPRADETLIVITADHGESFGEHYFVSHGAHLYEHNVRVPLLIRHPDTRGVTRVDTPVQTHRLFATLLGSAGLPVPEPADPGDISSPGTDVVLQVQRSDSNVRLFGDFFDRDLLAIQSWPHKLVIETTGDHELFDLDDDPEELHNLIADEPELAHSLATRLREAAARHPGLFPEDARAELRPSTEAALRALGYLD